MRHRRGDAALGVTVVGAADGRCSPQARGDLEPAPGARRTAASGLRTAVAACSAAAPARRHRRVPCDLLLGQRRPSPGRASRAHQPAACTLDADQHGGHPMQRHPRQRAGGSMVGIVGRRPAPVLPPRRRTATDPPCCERSTSSTSGGVGVRDEELLPVEDPLRARESRPGANQGGIPRPGRLGRRQRRRQRTGLDLGQVLRTCGLVARRRPARARPVHETRSSATRRGRSRRRCRRRLQGRGADSVPAAARSSSARRTSQGERTRVSENE